MDSIPNRLVNISPRWRSMRANQAIRWQWISSSRGRRESCLLYLELLPPVVPRLRPHCHLLFAVHGHLWRQLTLHLLSYFQTHLPGFVQQAEDLKGKGVQEVACISVNDAFVMAAWGKEHGADGKVFPFCAMAKCPCLRIGRLMTQQHLAFCIKWDSFHD